MVPPVPDDIARSAATTGSRGARLTTAAVTMIEAARRHGARLRLTGGLAVRRYVTDLDFMEREFSDIDLVGLSDESARIARAFEDLGYEENRHVSQATAGAQLQYLPRAHLLESRAHMLKRPRPLGPANVTNVAGDHVDVFLDVMRMDHDVDVRDRLDMDPYAIPPTDILLSKLQIGEIADKDVHDVVALLKDVPLGEPGDSDAGDTPRLPGSSDGQAIDTSRLARLCARDWGLYHDVIANLDLAAARLGEYRLPDADEARVRGAAVRLRAAVVAHDKSLRWRLRARVGTRLAWRREVEEREGSPVIAA